MAKLTHWLETRCREQRIASGVGIMLAAGAGFELSALLLWALEATTRPIQEITSIFLVISILLVLLLGVFWRFWRLLRSNTVLPKAREFGKEYPEEHDALETAVELERKSRNGTLRPFEQEYLAQLQEHYEADGFSSLRTSHAFARPRWWPQFLTAGALALSFLYLKNPVLQRAWRGLASRQPGIEFVGLPAEMERHQDLGIKVKINRYGGTATLEVREAHGAVVSHPMQGAGDAQSLTLYDVSQEFSVRARTPFVGTGWHRVAVYDPPRPECIAIDTTPPAYTGRTPQHLDDFGDLELIAGEAVHIACTMSRGQSWALHILPTAELPATTLSSPTPRAGGTSAVHIVNTPATASPDTLWAEYRDSAGHTARGPAFAITVKPDLLPAIELIEPTTETTCKPGEVPAILANVTDDFGVTGVEAHYLLDNQPETTQLLWTADGTPQTRQIEVTSRIDLAGVQLAPGQLLTGWLEATDNREPKSQRVRSELFFVTIVPDAADFEGNMEGMDGGEMHEVSVSDLIVESKRLLRNTFDLLGTGFEPPVAERLRVELERDLRALELAIRARSIDLAQQFGMPQLPPDIQQFFNDAAEQLVQAATDVTANALDDSRAPQQSALVTLVQLNNLLMENMMKMAGEGGETTKEPGESQNEEGEQQPSPPQTTVPDRQQQIAQLEQAREELRKILQEQRAILDDLRRANRLASAYAEPERLLATRTRNVAGKLAGIAETEVVQTPLRDAMTELDNSGQNFAIPGNQSTATIHARRAEKHLQDALTLLEQLLRQLTSQQIEKLGEDAQKLAARQRELAEDSRKFSENPPEDGKRKAAREAQEGLTQSTEELRQRIEQTARAMERDNPLSAKQLRATMTAEDTAALQRAQSRARNALTYRRYETAADEQETAAGKLEQLSERLAEAAAQTGLSPEQLQQALEEMQRISEEVRDGQTAEELAKLAQEASELASQAGRQLGNDALQMLAEELALLDNVGNTPELLRSQVLARIDQVREELRQELARALDNATRRRTPPATAPPRQYRQEVEEYFRRLGE